MKHVPGVLGLFVVPVVAALAVAACAATRHDSVSSDRQDGTVTFLYRNQAGDEVEARSPAGELFVNVVPKLQDGCSDSTTLYLDADPGSRFRVLARIKDGGPIGTATSVSHPWSNAARFWSDAAFPWLLIPLAVYGVIAGERCSNPVPDCCTVWIEDAQSGATVAGSPPSAPAPPPSWSPGALPLQPARGSGDEFVNCVVNGRRGWTYRSYCDR